MNKVSIAQQVLALANSTNRADGHHLFALIDGALQRSALERTKVFAPAHSVIPAGGVVARSDVSALPFLIEIPAANADRSRRLITELSEWAFEHSAVTWLESDLPITSLAAQLALRMEAELAQNLAVVLRFADARVLPVLYDTLDDAQRASFFSCMVNWWYVSRRGELQALPIQQEQAAELLSFEPPLRLTAAQEQQLVDAAEPDAVMQILRRHDAEALDQIAPGEQYDLIKSCVGRAKSWAVETPSDLAVFCMVALAQGPTFDEMPYWKTALPGVREGKATLIHLIQQQAAMS